MALGHQRPVSAREMWSWVFQSQTSWPPGLTSCSSALLDGGVARAAVGARVDVALQDVGADQVVAVGQELQVVAVGAVADRVEGADEAPVEAVDLELAGTRG